MNIFANHVCIVNNTSLREVALLRLLLVIHTCSWITCYVLDIGYTVHYITSLSNRTSLFLIYETLTTVDRFAQYYITKKYKILCVESVV